MGTRTREIVIITAPSILGLKPNGVELQAESLLNAGLHKRLHLSHPVIDLPVLNDRYSDQRDPDTHCLNTAALHDFSIDLGKALTAVLEKQQFALVLGGDCSILLGIMSALKAKGEYGLVFIDAHADFYAPEQSITGEVADMDLGMVTGRGPEQLVNIGGLQPYVKDEHVIQIGQRDVAETEAYGSREIRETAIRLFDMAYIENTGIEAVTSAVIAELDNWKVEGCWVHFDTDVLSDDVNPAVEYRLPGGLSLEQAGYLLRNLLLTGRITGITVTIFNPRLDPDGHIARDITDTLVRAFT